MIADSQLRWIVTVLLIASIVLWGSDAVRYLGGRYAARRREGVNHQGGRIGAIGHVLHIVMAVAMLDMTWPSAMYLSTRAGIAIFAAIGAWYVLCTAMRRYRIINGGYHVLMMAAMAWMYAVMSDDIFSGAGHHMGMSDMQMSMPGMDMPGMDMHSMDMSGMNMSMGAGLPEWAHVANWVCVVFFAIASVWWLYRYFAARQGNTDDCGGFGDSSPLRAAGSLGQVCMAVSMSAMFAVML